MSRSFKKAIINISKRIDECCRRAARHFVKQKLAQIDPYDVDGPDLCDIEADETELGMTDYGTQMGLEFANLDEFEYCDEGGLKKERRK